MGNLSQHEIDAMLLGELSSENGEGKVVLETSAPDEGQTENSNYVAHDVENPDLDESFKEDISTYFNDSEIDALGEVGNICIGTSATIMYKLLGRKVSITTPRVALYKSENVLAAYKCPFLAISVEFIEGLYGKNLLILKDYDAALITDLLMGGDGDVDPDNVVLNEIHLSAMSELMNQMMGSAATAMSDMMGDPVNISPPQVFRMEADENVAKFLDGATPVVKVSFDMEIEGLLKSKLLQIMPIDMAKDLIGLLMNTHVQSEPEIPEPAAPVKPAAPPAARPAASAKRSATPAAPPKAAQPLKAVKPAVFQSFDEPERHAPEEDDKDSNFDLINDIPLQVTVELGKSKKSLGEVLNLGIGSIVVLDKLAGELVDVIVNGKRIAKGEVVVIDENYGVRITELIK
jgi:flagellar motor switch protein FliN/FliY